MKDEMTNWKATGERSAWAAARHDSASRVRALCKSGPWPYTAFGGRFFGDFAEPFLAQFLPLEVERSKLNVESSECAAHEQAIIQPNGLFSCVFKSCVLCLS